MLSSNCSFLIPVISRSQIVVLLFLVLVIFSLMRAVRARISYGQKAAEKRVKLVLFIAT